MANSGETGRWTATHGARLRKKRLERGISQKEAAAFFKVSDDTLRNWEKGQTTPREESLASIAEFCEVPLDELLAPESEVADPLVLDEPASSSLAPSLTSVNHQGDVAKARSPKHRIAFASAVIAIALLAGVAVLARWHSQTFAGLRPTASGIEALSRSGKVLWRASGVDPVIASRWVTVRMPGGRSLVACVWSKPSDFRPEIQRVLTLLRPNANRPEVVDRIVLPTPGTTLFPTYANRYDLAYLDADDLDGDGVDEIIATFQEVPECVSYTILYEPVIRRSRVVFVQTGAHHYVGAYDINGDGRRDLLFVGINNGYDWINSLAAVGVEPWIGARETGDQFPVYSPDHFQYRPVEKQSLFYALLPRGRVPDDPAAVSWDMKRRHINVTLGTGRNVTLTPLGFEAPSRSKTPEAERATSRREAYRHDRECRSLIAAGFAKDAVAECREATAAAEQAGDAIVSEAMQRDLMKVLISAGHIKEAEELEAHLATTSENASEIAYDAAVAFHLVGDLRKAVSYYEAGIRRGASPEAGKSKHEFLQGEVFALVELGEFDEAIRATERVRERYVTNHDWTATYREFIRWQKGETPRRIEPASNATDLLRYWDLEFRNARGENPEALLARRGCAAPARESAERSAAITSRRAPAASRQAA